MSPEIKLQPSYFLKINSQISKVYILTKPIFNVILYVFSGRAYAIGIQRWFLNIGYGYFLLAVPVSFT